MNIASSYLGTGRLSLHKTSAPVITFTDPVSDRGVELGHSIILSLSETGRLSQIFKQSFSGMIRCVVEDEAGRYFMLETDSSEVHDIDVKVDIFLTPSWHTIQENAASYINIFSSILKKTPAHLFLFDSSSNPLCYGMFNREQRYEERRIAVSEREQAVKGFETDCMETLVGSISEKRFMMLQVKDADDPDKATLKVFEPVLNDRHEVLFVYLAIFRLADLRQTEIFVLNQFLAIESAMDGIALLNENGEYYYLNDTHVKMFGYETEQELVGKSWQIIYPAEEIQRIGEHLFPVLMANGKWSGQTKGISKQGKYIYQDISLTTLPNGGMICVCRDVTQRRIQEEQLALNDRILRNTSSMIIITNAALEIEWVNEAFTATTGYLLEDVIGKRPGKVLQGKGTDPEAIRFMRSRINAGEPFHCETINYKKNGEPYWIEIRCQPLFGANGKVEKYFAIEEDITYKKKAGEELRKSQMLLEMALEASGNAVWEWNLTTGIAHIINLREMLGYEEDDIDVSLENYFGLIHLEDLASTLDHMRKYQEGLQESCEFQERLLTKSGQYIWVLQRSRVVERDENGLPVKVVGNTINIDRLKRIEEQLIASEERWKIALEGSGAGIGEIDFQKRKIWLSSRAIQFLGYSSASELSESLDLFIETIHPDDRKAAVGRLEDYLTGKTGNYESEFRLRCKDGSYRWFDFHGSISRRNPAGRPLAFIGSAYDINDRKVFEEKLRLSEERWKFAIDGAKAGIYDWDLSTGLVYYSDRAKELHGLSGEGNLFDSNLFFDQFIYKEDLLGIQTEANKIINGALDHIELDYRVVHPLNGLRWVNDRAMVVQRNANGIATRIIGIYFDITDKKVLNEKLKQSEQRWIFALEGSSSGVWDYNLDNGEVFYSNKLKELLGYSPGDPFENSISQYNRLVHPEERELSLEQLRKYLTGALPAYETEQRAMHKDGTYHWYLNKGIIANRDENGVATRVIGTVTDITSRKKNELELIHAKEMALASAKAKKVFLANMSHEIRTPMNAILGLSDQMLQTSMNPDQQFLMNIINDAAKSLQVLIDDVLDFTKIEEGQLKLEHIEFDLQEQLRRIISLLLHKAQEKNISIRLDFDWRIASVVLGDPNRLNQILINIVGNAIKFTREGYVKVICKLVKKEDNRQMIEFLVSDTGIGMSEDTLQNLFKEFYQEDQSIARKFGGTGLGLSISRNLVQLMNGTIEVNSQKEVGTDVAIQIPFEISDKKFLEVQKRTLPAEKHFFEGKRVLLVEDNKVNRIVASIILRKMDMQIDEAENGKAALHFLEENQYDIILMDLQMPELDGISATGIIRKNKITTPIIALTANAVQEELEELLGKGFTAYVVKPFEEQKLLLKMQECFNKEKAVGVTSSGKPSYVKRPNKSLGSLFKENSSGDFDTEQALVAAFKYEMQSAIEELTKAIDHSNLDLIKKLAHKQKSMLLSLGLKDESKTILFLSKMDLQQADPKEALRKARALSGFFSKIYNESLNLYPDSLSSASLP